MSQATNFLEAAILDHLFGLSAYSAPATVYLGLFTALADGEAASFTEVAGGSYARKAITNDATEWSRTSNVVTNDNLQAFATASANWGTVTHWGLFDASSGGNLLIYGELPNATVVNNGSTFRVGAGQLSFTYNAKSNYAAGKLLDHLFGIASWTVPDPVYPALFTSAPTDAGGGTEVSTSGTDYARESVTNDGTSWTRTNNSVVNDNDIEYDEAADDYGTVSAVGVFDDPTAGNLLWWTALSPSQTVNTGSQFAFEAGQLEYLLD